MSNITKFESAKVPAHLSKFAGMFGGNEALGKNGPSYPVLNFKGKVWSVVENKEKTRLTNSDGEPLQGVQVVIIRAQEGLSKVFYKEGYDEEASAGQKPDCSSNDGIKPDAGAAEKQAKTCAVCPHNVWGSGSNGKGRACSDSKRIAVAPENDIENVMLLRVPPASLKGLAEFGANLSKKGVPFQAVVTRVTFDPEASSPKLVFKPKGFVSEDDLATIAELQEHETVKAILGIGEAPAAEEHVDDEDEAPVTKTKAKPAPAPVEEDDEDETPAPAPKTAAKRTTKAKPAPVQQDMLDDDEDEVPAPAPKTKAKPAPVDDDEDEVPAPAPKTKAKPKATVAEPDDDLNSIIDGLDLDD